MFRILPLQLLGEKEYDLATRWTRVWEQEHQYDIPMEGEWAKRERLRMSAREKKKCEGREDKRFAFPHVLPFPTASFSHLGFEADAPVRNI